MQIINLLYLSICFVHLPSYRQKRIRGFETLCDIIQTILKITQTKCWITSKILTLVHSDIMLLGVIHYFPLVCEICLTEWNKNFEGQTTVLEVGTEASKDICRPATQTFGSFLNFMGRRCLFSLGWPPF